MNTRNSQTIGRNMNMQSKNHSLADAGLVDILETGGPMCRS